MRYHEIVRETRRTGYHGTTADFRGFMLSKSDHPSKIGIWFASTAEAATAIVRHAPRRGGQPRLITATIELANPRRYPAYADFLRDYRDTGSNVGLLRRRLRRDGHDGVEITRSDTDHAGLRTDWAVFDRSQIEIMDSIPLERLVEQKEEDGDKPRHIRDLSSYFSVLNAQEDQEGGEAGFDPSGGDETHHEYVRHNYLFGECVVFAIALHRMTGWPIFQMRFRNSFHVFLQHPSGAFVDASGFTTLNQIRKTHRMNRTTAAKLTTPQALAVDGLDDDSLSDPWHAVRLAEFYIRQLTIPPFPSLTPDD